MRAPERSRGRRGVGDARRRDAVPAVVEAWHAWPVARVAEALRSDVTAGLSTEEVAARRARYGPNTLPRPRGRPAWRIAVDQLRSVVVAFLAASAAIALLSGYAVEAAAIAVVIVLNALVGFATEWRAAQAIDALQREAASTARVLRGGREQPCMVDALVSGDVMLLAEGDRVPADARLLESARLQVEEALLTGESEPVEKRADAVLPAGAPLAERVTMVYLGTIVTAGRARAIVTATGRATEVGRIGVLLEGAEAPSTPLERRLEALGRALIAVVLAVAVVVIAVGVLRGHALLEMVKVALALAIAAVPEGLPAVATMTLAIGVQRMARANAIVRRLPAVETLGTTTVICTDKTGTLTRNDMTVERVVVPGARFDLATAPEAGARSTAWAHSSRRDAALPPPVDRSGTPSPPNEHLRAILEAGALCNDAHLAPASAIATHPAPARATHRARAAAIGVPAAAPTGPAAPAALGDPTEVALLVAAQRAGVDVPALRAARPRVAEIPFDAAARWMATHHAVGAGTVTYAKGAPAALLDRCRAVRAGLGTTPLGEEERAAWLAAADALAADALRVLAIATRSGGPDDGVARDGFTLLGLVGMGDPLRSEAAAAVARCRAAGIRTVLVTGDHPRTATVIAERLGLLRGLDGAPQRTITGVDLDALDDDGWRDAVAHAGVFARVTPEHKLRIVQALQARGEVVAMTGDGVNDAPALHAADIGIAMGGSGTEVAKQAAAMVLRDDDFGTIVRAVEQGRVIYANVRRFAHYLFSCNMSEALVVFGAIAIGMPLPLAALQILWLNLVTDVFPALALALEPSDPHAMQQPPRPSGEALLPRAYAIAIASQGVLLAIATLLAFAIALAWYPTDAARAGTIAFATLACTQVAHTFEARSLHASAFTRGDFGHRWLWIATAVCIALTLLAIYLPGLQSVLHTTPLTARDWALVAPLALLPMLVIEGAKAISRAGALRG